MMTFRSSLALALSLMLLSLVLSSCDDGPKEADMAGCAVRRAGPPLTQREVADCAVERAQRRQSDRR